MKKRITNYIVESDFYQKLIAFLKKVKFRRYDDLSLYEIIMVFIGKVTKDEIIERANGVAFNFTLAIFPAIIFLFTLTPYIHQVVPDVSKDSILQFIGEMLPQNMYETVFTTVEDIVGNTRGGLLTFGALFSLYLATNGMMSLMKAFNACYKTIEKRGFLKMRLVATALTVMLAFALILASILLVIGNFFIEIIYSFEWLDIEAYQIYIFFLLRFIVLFIVFFIAISFIYYFGPAVHYNWRFFSIGSLIATLLCMAVTYGFSFYVSNFATYNKLYGSLGVLIALMIWQEILSIVLLVGYEVNASVHHAFRISGIDYSKLSAAKK
ncbi:Inner membrane protein YihY, formerly thought to be RNase BN [Fulvivirga imtechensis AK7]|uniref:Inner membrane protein YihY, formerly thought to be RNase BN n=1 Tax=Fulvivirga imtechensis AK7 TaxID=1237149 RepID=L8JPQ8_9BACT|nr:YihY/virulence factor BrkB family protein [Fulvivirga imtechensis]ELR70188.1 Inner membrane protein YihY, formerly thought to be RNase BN [Fulvivirga imtechensis AK7]